MYENVRKIDLNANGWRSSHCCRVVDKLSSLGSSRALMQDIVGVMYGTVVLHMVDHS